MNSDETSFVNDSLHFLNELIRKLEQLKDVNLMSFRTSVDEMIQLTNNFKASKLNKSLF